MATKLMDVTSRVDFQNPDDEALPLTKCVCGKRFDAWEFIISIYDDIPSICPNCKRKLIFSNRIHVYEVH